MVSTAEPAPLLPVEIVFHPSWWHEHAGIVFDEDFFYHPLRRVEAERTMEKTLFERFGRFGLGADHDRDLPQVGAVHNAAGYLLQEMLGCKVNYAADAPPLVVPDDRENLDIDLEAPFASPAFRKLEKLVDALETRHGHVTGDINWAGILNIALDLRGQEVFLDLIDHPEETRKAFGNLADVIERFTGFIRKKTGTTSVSVNRLVRHLPQDVHLHSECTHTMISVEHYERFLMPFDHIWSERHRPFGIHYCGADPHRFAEAFGKLPHLDFLDVGAGGDVKRLRKHLPDTFLNLRLDPTKIVDQGPDEIRNTVIRLVEDSGNPALTGVCCINMDDRVTDAQVTALFETVAELRERAARDSG